MSSDAIRWEMSGTEIEQESFSCIENEMGPHPFDPLEWPVVRRMIHACADFAIVRDIRFGNNPVQAIHRAVAAGAPVYCDSNMIRSGISILRLARINPTYTRDSVLCYIADADVARNARQRNGTRALAALEKAGPLLQGAIVLIGNAPLALAGLVRMIKKNEVRPAVVIGVPVGFVHVVESKEMLMETDVPQIVLQGRRGGSPLAVAALHGALETCPASE